MLSKAQNERLARVGPGTPAGDMLRRYWHPIAVAAELKDKPVRRVRILGEDLVLYRGADGRYGLVEERCPHRGASLAYGKIEGNNLRCAYHGWLFSPEGRCLEQPAEPPGSTYKNRIRQPAYPVEKMAGLLYAYLGPKPAPLFPRYDVLVRNNGQRRLVVLPQLDCNWLQPMENSVDPTHTAYLHSGGRGKPTHGDRDVEVAKYEFELFEYGIMKKRFARNSGGTLEMVNAHPLIFPNMLRQHHGKEHYIQYRVPVDDTHTLFFEVYFLESPDGAPMEQAGEPPVEYASPHKTPDGVYTMERVWMQDFMAWETAGAIYDRRKEHLATGDRGVIIFRKLLQREIARVKARKDPMGVIRDPKKNEIVRFETVTDNERGVWRSR